MSDADPQELAQNAKRYWSAEGYTEGGVIREVDYASQSGGLHPSLAGIRIVDTDTHITEAPDLFTSRAPAALKDKMPVVKRVNDTDRWFVGDRDFGTLGGNVIRADKNMREHFHPIMLNARQRAITHLPILGADCKRHWRLVAA